MLKEDLERKVEANFFGITNLIVDFKNCLKLTDCSKRGSTKHLKLLAAVGKQYFEEIENDLKRYSEEETSSTDNNKEG